MVLVCLLSCFFCLGFSLELIHPFDPFFPIPYREPVLGRGRQEGQEEA